MVTTMRKNMLRLLAAAVLLIALPALSLAADFAVVKGGRLNLREYASTGSRSLGKYASGSWVEIINGGSNGFAYVRTMDGKRGYMSQGYLNFGSAGNEATVRYANGGYVNLRSGPSLDYAVIIRVTSGTSIRILDETTEWNYVTVPQTGHTGYMHDSLINKNVSSATVTTRNGGKVNVRSGPSSSYASVGSLRSGTKVSVLNKGNGWYQISGGGITGFMSTSYLSGTGSTVGSNTGSSGGSTASQIAYVNNPRSTQVLNLRERPSQSARSIGQYRNGTQVKVVAYGNTWCEVYVGTKHGYMMTRYLSFNGSYLPPTVYATPTPVYVPPVVYATPTPTPLVQLITPEPTPLVQFITPVPAAPQPTAGTQGTLAVRAGSSETTINVYNDASLTSLKATYAPGTVMTILSYGDSVCMILVGNSVAYVSTWNVNY